MDIKFDLYKHSEYLHINTHTELFWNYFYLKIPTFARYISKLRPNCKKKYFDAYQICIA